MRRAKGYCGIVDENLNFLQQEAPEQCAKLILVDDNILKLMLCASHFLKLFITVASVLIHATTN